MATETARLKSRYLEEIRPALVRRFGYSSIMQAPKLEKITLNMGVGDAKQDSNMLKAAQNQLATIAGQRPSVRKARKSIAAFKLREGMPVGVAVTLRGERGYEFLDRLVSIAIPRIRDFRGLNPRSFDGRGNYTIGVREQIIFPEIDYDSVGRVRGLDITITTTAGSDAEAFALLQSLGMPFARDGRPAGFDEDDSTESPEPTASSGSAEASEAPTPTAEAMTETAPDEAQAAEAPDEPEVAAETPEPEPEPEPAGQGAEPETESEAKASAETAEDESSTEAAEDSNEKESTD